MICRIEIEHNDRRYSVSHWFTDEELNGIRADPVDICLAELSPKLREIVQKSLGGPEK